ncbi:MAG: histidine phosphatase family protein [Pseudomonadota bacterium]
MPLTLILMRHAKSSWSDPEADDFDRALNSRGRASAPAMGRWLSEHGYLPDEVIVSGARRTVETWSHMAAALPATASMRSDPMLYHAASEAMLVVLRNAFQPTTMLIGHNPGITEFAHRLAGATYPHDRYGDFPTAATAIITFGAETWREIVWSDGTVTDFAVPGDVLDSA